MRPAVQHCFALASCVLLCAAVSFVNAQAQQAAAGPGAAASPSAGPDTSQKIQDSLPPVDSMPRLLEFVKADYPAELVKKGVEGDVLLDLVVDTAGTVDSVAVVKGFHPQLDSSAKAAALRFMFAPAKAGGRPVAVIMEYLYRFSIQDVVEKIDRYVNLKGRLIERGTRAPVRDATVVVTFRDTTRDTTLRVPFGAYLKKICKFGQQHCEENAVVTLTDSLGRYDFYSLPACPITIKVICPGYEQVVENDSIKYGEANSATYYMHRVSYSEYEITVYGKEEKKEVAKYTLTLNEVRKVPGLGGDAVKVIQALPGVARSPFSTGVTVVRGSGVYDTRFFLDGIQLPMPQLFHFGGLKSTYNSDALESVDLYPGGFGTRYGGALAGIIEIKGRRPKTDRLHGYVDANLFDASVFVEGPVQYVKNVSFLFTARRSYIADVIAFFAKDVFKQNLYLTVVPYYWDYIFRTDLDMIKNQHLYFTFFGTKDRLDLISSRVRGGSTDVDQQTNSFNNDQYFHMGIAGWDWTVSPTVTNELRYAMVYYFTGVSAFGRVKVEGSTLAHYIRDQYSIAANDRLKINIGCDMAIIPYDLTLLIPNEKQEIVKDTTHYLFGPMGVYVNVETKPLKRLTLIPGLRFDYYPELDYKGSIVPEFWDYKSFNNSRGISGEPSLRLTAKYETAKNQKLKGSLGTYNQTPQPMGQAINKHWGNPSLPAEKSSQYVLGYEWQATDLVNADVQVYYNRQWDNARRANAADLAKSPLLYLGDGLARMYGMEIMLRHDQGRRFFGWISYSLSRSERYDYLEKKWDLFAYDQTHNLQLIGSLRLPHNWEIGARARYVTGDPTTPVLGPDYFDATKRRYVPLEGATNSDRMAPYLSIDMRIEKKFVFKKWMLLLYCDITNLSNLFGYGYKSPEFNDYIWNFDYTEKSVLSDITRPALGMKIDF
jgi:TonB family protein